MKNAFVRGALAATLTLVSAGVMAQENGNRDERGGIVRGPYETNRFFDNIFIGIAGGVNVYHGENDSHGGFGKRLAPALDLNVGKWITPAVGVRIGYSGLNAKGWTFGQTVYAKSPVGEGFYREKFGVSYLHGDFMWNLSDAVSGYKQTRAWNFVPFLGAGWARSYGNGTYKNEFALSAGLLNDIRLCDLLDLTLEMRHLFVNQRFDGVARGSRGEGMTSVTVGLSFKLNRRGFRRVKPVAAPDYTPYLTRIDALENARNILEAEKKTLADENARLREREPETVQVASVSATPVALFFRIGQATLDKKELANLDFYVKNALEADREKVFTLCGSADKATGTAAGNQRLSEKRMEYVYKLLVEKYGVAKERLRKVAEGDRNNLFADPELNRAVIIR